MIVQQSAMISVPNSGSVDRDELERLLAEWDALKGQLR